MRQRDSNYSPEDPSAAPFAASMFSSAGVLLSCCRTCTCCCSFLTVVPLTFRSCSVFPGICRSCLSRSICFASRPRRLLAILARCSVFAGASVTASCGFGTADDNLLAAAQWLPSNAGIHAARHSALVQLRLIRNDAFLFVELVPPLLAHGCHVLCMIKSHWVRCSCQ